MAVQQKEQEAAWGAFLIVRWALVMGIVLLAMTGVSGVGDSEKVMPLVLKDFLPTYPGFFTRLSHPIFMSPL